VLAYDPVYADSKHSALLAPHLMLSMKSRLKALPLAAAANARLKAWLVEREAASLRLRYQRDGLPPAPTGNALREALDARIATRKSALGWPKPRGGLHIFLAYSVMNWEAVLPEALAEFGEVSAFDWRANGYEEEAPDWQRQRPAMNEALLNAFEQAHRRRPVDLVVGYVSGNTVDPDVLHRMAQSGAVITNFCFDDKSNWPGDKAGGRYLSTAGVAHAVDLNLTSDPQGINKYFAHGGLAMFHAEAADPRWYHPLDLPFEHDVSFVGACYGWRPRLIEGLQQRGIEVTCFGRGWPRGALVNGDMNGLYARSRINLGFGGIGYSKTLLCLKGRDFEVPMSGAVYLTQNNPELKEVFEVGTEILTYDDIEDCARTIRSLLADEARAGAIRLAAQARSLKDHTYSARWSTVLRVLGALH
jgi:hypothetical protein